MGYLFKIQHKQSEQDATSNIQALPWVSFGTTQLQSTCLCMLKILLTLFAGCGCGIPGCGSANKGL